MSSSILTQPTLLNFLCKKLSFLDVDTFRRALNLTELECPIFDPDNQIRYIRLANIFSSIIADSIEKEGSINLFFKVIDENNFDAVKFLVESGFDVNTPDESGNIGLVFASDKLEIAEYLLNSGSDPNFPDENEMTFLMEASMSSREYEFAKLLVEYANLDAQSVDEMTALMYAATNKQIETVKLLLEKGADPNLQNFEGETALMQIVRLYDNYSHDSRIYEIIKLLLENGANPTVEDIYGTTSYELAKYMKLEEIAKVIKPYLDKI